MERSHQTEYGPGLPGDGIPQTVDHDRSTPIDLPAKTKEFMRTLAREAASESGIDDAQLIRALREAERGRRLEEETRRIEAEAARGWVRRHWKRITTIGGILSALGTVGWKTASWVGEAAEERVLERQAAEAQAAAVQDNATQVRVLTSDTTDVKTRLGQVETNQKTIAATQQLQLELQLGTPSVKRLLKNDEKLKARVEALPKLPGPPP